MKLHQEQDWNWRVYKAEFTIDMVDIITFLFTRFAFYILHHGFFRLYFVLIIIGIPLCDALPCLRSNGATGYVNFIVKIIFIIIVREYRIVEVLKH